MSETNQDDRRTDGEMAEDVEETQANKADDAAAGAAISDEPAAQETSDNSTADKAADVQAAQKAPSAKHKRDFSYTQNRELSWLEFNHRVLDEALDETVPLYERLKFIAIFDSNLDEFFMVRVGSLTDLTFIDPDDRENKSNMTAAEQIDAINAAVKPLIKLRNETYKKVMGELAAYGVEELDLEEMSKKERKFARDYYREYLVPILSPQVIDARHPFPHLRNKDLYVATMLTDEDGSKTFGLVPVPDEVPGIISDPENPLHFVRTEQVIKHNIGKLFGIYKAENPVIISVTRNADISFDEEKFADDESDYRLHVSNLLKKRNRLNPVRLEIQGNPDKALRNELMNRLKLDKSQVYIFDSPISIQDCYSFEGKLEPSLKSELCYPPFAPRNSKVFDQNKPILDQVETRDRLLFYPYDSMEPFLRMLQEAAIDPTVASIKITVYRLASESRVAQHLIEAAENGKDVTVLMELRARFDEANNIDWSQRLEEAGCTIIYGMENYKCHSKICLITRRKGDRVINITQIGTGNYNEKTAKLYTDLCMFTADETIGNDAVNFFQNMLIGNLNGAYESLLVAPATMKQTIMSLIDREISKGDKGRILIKANSVTERDIIDELAAASQAGVHIRMNIRGICCLLPGIEGKTDNILVRSIVGQFLEHSRIYCFGEGDDMQLYISSADLMTRNLVHRVEVAAPIHDPDLRASICLYLEKIFADNTKARTLMPDGSYVHVADGPEAALMKDDAPFCLHDWCIEHPLQRVDTPKRRAAVRTASNAKVPSASTGIASESDNGLPPIGQRTLWQRIKAVFLGD
ncbi:MAG: polyphosphate kinase 1 [Coriobacteriales bacterium]